MTVVIEPAALSDVADIVALLQVLFTQEAEFAPDADRQRRGVERVLVERPPVHLSRDLVSATRQHNNAIDLDSKAINELTTKHGVQVRRTPDEILKAQLVATDKLFEDESKKNPFFAKVLASQREFASRVVPHVARIQPELAPIVDHYWKK